MLEQKLQDFCPKQNIRGYVLNLSENVDRTLGHSSINTYETEIVATLDLVRLFIR